MSELVRLSADVSLVMGINTMPVTNETSVTGVLKCPLPMTHFTRISFSEITHTHTHTHTHTYIYIYIDPPVTH